MAPEHKGKGLAEHTDQITKYNTITVTQPLQQIKVLHYAVLRTSATKLGKTINIVTSHC